MNTSAVLRGLVAVLLSGLCNFAGAQQNYPNKPIRIVTPYAPGGATTLLGRMLGDRFTQAWGQQVLLDNRLQAMIIEPFDYPTLENARIRAQTMVLEFDDPPVPHGLIMSRKALPPDQQQAWRALVDAMRADGTVTRIFEKYFKPELARQLTQF